MNLRNEGWSHRRRGVFGLAVVFALAWAGCVALHQSAPAAAPQARVAIANLTDYTWEIAVKSASGSETRTERVAPRTIAQWSLAGGDYVIEQALVGEAIAAEPVRRFAARFVVGVDYKWSLATLNSFEPRGPALAAR